MEIPLATLPLLTGSTICIVMFLSEKDILILILVFDLLQCRFSMGNTVRKQQNLSGNGNSQNCQATVFYTDKSLHHSAHRTVSSISSSSIGASSDCSWVTAQENTFDTTIKSLEDLDNFEDFHDPSSTLSNLLAQAGEDQFMKTVLAFCSYMEGRMDKLDNA
ncbi:unnamed protein product, partial [Meganyctiphanes norvegica]